MFQPANYGGCDVVRELLREVLAAMFTVDFWLILSVAVASIAGVAWFYAVPLGAAGLMLLAWPKYAALPPRVWRTGAERAFVVTMSLSTLNALGASAAAFALGAVIRWGFL